MHISYQIPYIFPFLHSSSCGLSPKIIRLDACYSGSCLFACCLQIGFYEHMSLEKRNLPIKNEEILNLAWAGHWKIC